MTHHIDPEKLKNAIAVCRGGWNDEFNETIIEAAEALHKLITAQPPAAVFRQGYWMDPDRAAKLDAFEDFARSITDDPENTGEDANYEKEPTP